MLNETKSPIKVGVDHSLESSGFHSVSTDAGFAMENVSAEQRSIGLPSLWRNITFYLIGLLLLFTAIAKLSMLMTDSFADVRVGLPKGILWTSVVIELWLAYLNLRSRDQNNLAVVNVIVFSSFAIFAAFRLMLGYQSCGCSGGLEIPGWVFLLIDISIVSWFVIGNRNRAQVSSGASALFDCWRNLSLEKRGRAAGVALFAGVFVLSQLPFSAPLMALVAGGEPPVQAIVSVESDLILGQPADVVVEVLNNSSYPTKIVGMAKSCKCFALTGNAFEKIVPANDRLVLSMRIKPGETGPLRQRIVFFIDHPKQFEVNVDLFTNVLGVE